MDNINVNKVQMANPHVQYDEMNRQKFIGIETYENLEGKGFKQVEKIQKSMSASEIDESKMYQEVCIHWLKGHCKNGEKCTFLHVDIPERRPICNHYKKTGWCSKGENCQYRHPELSPLPETPPRICNRQDVQICPYYDRGFCHKGIQNCKFWSGHNMLEQICVNYVLGFCPSGTDCMFKHVKSVVIDEDCSLKSLANFPDCENWQNQATSQALKSKQNVNNQKAIICHICGVMGHKATFCNDEKIDPHKLDEILAKNSQVFVSHNVTCYSCDQKGHFADRCPNKTTYSHSQPGAGLNPENFQRTYQRNGTISMLGKRPFKSTQLKPRQRWQIMAKNQVNLQNLSTLKPFSLQPSDINLAISQVAAQIGNKD